MARYAAPVSSTGPPPNFAQAARRHYDDATHLLSQERLGSAEHFAGFAAECALKVILLRFLGATLNSAGLPQNGQMTYRHLPRLWNDVGLTATGRSGAVFAALLAKPNPFTRWAVSDRYTDATHISKAQVEDHLNAAREIITLQQSAVLSGQLS